MNRRKKLTLNPRYFYLNLLPQKQKMHALGILARKFGGLPPITLSKFHSRAKHVLYVLPDSPLETALQLPTLVSLQKYFHGTAGRILCNADIAELVSGLAGLPKPFIYSESETRLFSRYARDFIETLRLQHFDTCFLLDRTPDPALCFLCTASGIPVRAGYAGEEADAFLNFAVKPSAQTRFAGDKNLALLRALGVPDAPPPEPGPSGRERKQEARDLLAAQGMSDTGSAVCISGNLDAALTGELVPLLVERGMHVVFTSLEKHAAHHYSFASRFPGSVFTCPPLSFDEAAGVLGMCRCFISGKDAFLYLASYLGMPVIAVIPQNDLDLWAKPSQLFHAVAQNHAPETAGQVIDLLEKKTGAAQQAG